MGEWTVVIVGILMLVALVLGSIVAPMLWPQSELVSFYSKLRFHRHSGPYNTESRGDRMPEAFKCSVLACSCSRSDLAPGC